MTTTPTTRLPISTCQVLSGDGARTWDDIVYCPSRDHTVEIGACLTCGHASHVRLAGAGTSSLVCDQVGASGPAPVDPMGADTVGTIMTRVVHCARADLSVPALAALLVDTGVDGVPVVDLHRHVIGVVSKSDVVRALHDGRDPAQATVADLMSPIALVLLEQASIERAAALMAAEGIHRLPVVASDGTVVGIVSALDVTRAVARRAGLTGGAAD